MSIVLYVSLITYICFNFIDKYMETEVVEEWKQVIGYEDLYLVSSLGRIKGLKRKTVLKPFKNKRGYLEVNLYKNSKSIPKVLHRRVALAFIPNPENKPQVNHINGNKLDNRVENLEWCTNSENQLHAYKTGLKELPLGELNNNTNLTNVKVNYIIEQYNIGKRAITISNEMNTSIYIIRNIIKNRTWTHLKKDIKNRDDRKYKTKEDINKTIITKYNKGILGKSIVQLTKDGEEISIFRSINQASVKTGIPRKSIEAVVNKKKFYSKDKTKFWVMKEAGNYLWEVKEISNLNQYL